MDTKPFDAFEQELRRVHELASGNSHSLLHSVSLESLTFSSVFNFGSQFLQRPLANAIAWPFLRRFSNRFLTAMLAELQPPSSAHVNTIVFDVAALSFLYHVTSEAATMEWPHLYPMMLAKGVFRWVTGRPGFVYPQIQKQLNRNAMPWIVKTTGAFIHSAYVDNRVSIAEAQSLLSKYSAKDVLEFRKLRADDPHPVAGYTIHECLLDSEKSGYSDYLTKSFDGRWTIEGQYRSSLFTLSDYEP